MSQHSPGYWHNESNDSCKLTAASWLQASDSRTAAPKRELEWKKKRAALASLTAVDKVSSLVTRDKATGEDWVQFLFCLVTLLPAGQPTLARQLSADIRSVTRKAHSGGADKWVCRLFWPFCAKQIFPGYGYTPFCKNPAVSPAGRGNLHFLDMHNNSRITGGADFNSSGSTVSQIKPWKYVSQHLAGNKSPKS